MLESQIENTVCNLARKRGWFVRKLKWDGRANAPDRLFSHAQYGTFYIEFKAPGKEPRPAQYREIRLMEEAGMRVGWFDNVNDALDFLGICV